MSNGTETLTLETIADLSEGQAAATVNAAIRAALTDCEDRGSDKKPRKVNIELEFVKIGDQVACKVKAKTTVPPYVTEPTVGEFAINGRSAEMRFRPASNRIDQPNLPHTGKDD